MMAGILLALTLAFGMWAMFRLTFGRKPPRLEVRRPGQLTAAERRHLYRRLRIDPEALKRQRRVDLQLLIPDQFERRRR